jgi:hypothetical protein
MKLAEVVIGQVYEVRVSGRISQVRVRRVEQVARFGRSRTRWYGVNLETGREVSGTPARLRRRVDENQAT